MAGASTAQRGNPGPAREGKGSGSLKRPKAPRAPKSPKPPRGSGPEGSGRSWPRGPLLPRGLRRGPALVAGLVLAMLLAAGCTWVLYGSSWLRVEKVTAGGIEVLTPDQVLAAAAVPVGAPMVSVDTDEIAARLRGKLPRIDSVEVVRAWPHGIGLKVTERKPVLLIKKGNEFVEVDVSGVRFDTVAKAPGGVPVLELAADRSASGRRFDEERLLHEAVGIAGGLPEAIRKETAQVKVGSYDSVVLELTRGRTVIWGSGEQGDAKGRALSALLKASPKADRFDVSVPTAPAVSGS
ncbi:cell division protein FtsQ/DivIB [Streptomyces sp. NBC_00454]|uniref:cell division protein FtsQ/DivIB n=1 Tax=Streptomyces sp. NBC_00454 TaxID=2975747 RepID=UPI00352F6B40